MNDYWVYMVRCEDGSFYAGITDDIDRRVGEHQSGAVPTCYTFRRRPVMLVYSARFGNVNDAIAWEKQIKGWSRRKKQALIDGDWQQIRTLSKKRTVPQSS